VGGVAIGLAASWLLSQVERRMEDPLVEIVTSFLLPYAVYLAAEQVHVSSVLAVVAAGLYSGWRSPLDLSATTRTQAVAIWQVAEFVLNGLVFVLVGLQLRGVVESLGTRSTAGVLAIAAAVSLAVLLIRFVWVVTSTSLIRVISRTIHAPDPYPSLRRVSVVAWTGMRGVVSLAAALSLPLQTSVGAPFPYRDLIIFVTFAVILVTLVGQGLSLPLVIRALGISGADEGRQEEVEARFQALDAGLRRVDELDGEDWANQDALDYMRRYYGKRRKALSTRFGLLDEDHEGDGHQHAEGSDHVADHRQRYDAFRRVQEEVLTAERYTLVQLRNRGTINDLTLRAIQRDLDLEELQLASS
jgi:NhaP-type Na+/H+ or K+/H+ antiporter